MGWSKPKLPGKEDRQKVASRRMAFVRYHAIVRMGVVILKPANREHWQEVRLRRTVLGRYHAIKQTGWFRLKLADRDDRQEVNFQRQMFGRYHIIVQMRVITLKDRREVRSRRAASAGRRALGRTGRCQAISWTG